MSATVIVSPRMDTNGPQVVTEVFQTPVIAR